MFFFHFGELRTTMVLSMLPRKQSGHMFVCCLGLYVWVWAILGSTSAGVLFDGSGTLLGTALGEIQG